MPFINRYSETVRGALTFTGNTSGLSKLANANLAGTVASIGAFTSLNNALQVGDFPAGTTLNISENGSSAQFVLPPGGSVLYAELIWGGNYFGQDANTGNQVDITGLINNSVLFTTPVANQVSIAPDPATAQEQSIVFNPGTPFDFVTSFYERTQDVTALVQAGGPGTYSVEQIPGLTSPIDNETIQTNHAGWTLAVAYEDTTQPYRNLNIWVGSELISQTGTLSADIPISGFQTPSSGPVTARVLSSAQEGDATVSGDQMLFGPTVGTLTNLSGPNNPVNNFFASQINNNSGNLDTTGTFGNRNQNAIAGTNIVAGRQGWDITNVDGSSNIANNQTSAVVRITTTGEAYMLNTLGVQIDSAQPIVNISKVVDKTEAIRGDNLTYTLEITNTGDLSTGDFHLIDIAPLGTQIIPGSAVITNETGPVTDNTTPAQLDIQLGAIAVGQVVTVEYTATTDGTTPSPVQNDASGSFTFVPLPGQPSISGDATSNNVSTDLATVTQTKAVNHTEAEVGDIITYTVTIDNTNSTADATSVFVYDDLQAGTSYVPNTTIIGANPPINSDPSIAPGIPVGIVLAGTTQTVSFDVSVDLFPNPNPIENTADITFTVGTSTVTQSTNITDVLVVTPDISVVKSVDMTLAQVGDILTYTTVITNTGDVDIDNIVFNDPPPANTIFVPNSVLIDGNNYPALDPNNPIDYNLVPVIPSPFPLAPGSSTTVIYSVTVDSLPAPPQVDNTATIDYDYTVDGATRTKSENSNTVTTDIFELTVVKSVDRVAAEGLDTITYTSTITSTLSGDTLNSIIFRDLVPAETTFVPGSITVIGVGSFTDNSTANEVIIDLGTVLPPNPITVIHQVLIDSNAQGPILNTSSVDIRNVTTNSNQVVTDIVNLIVSKSSDITEGEVGDIITYSVTIDNSQSDAPINNVFVYDSLQVGTSYVPNTTIIGANPAINSDPSVAPGASVGTIAAGAIVIVSFQVSINSVPNPNPIENAADINYEVDTIPKTQSTNPTEVLVLVPDIDATKSVDITLAQVGDILTYTTAITNTGTVDIDNIVFNDPPPANTTFVVGSTIIDGSSYPGVNPNNSIDYSLVPVIPSPFPLSPGEFTTISYSVTVDSLPVPPQVDNTATIDYDYTVDGATRNKSENSNTVTTDVFELTVVKSVDRVAAEGLDTITYTSTITSTLSGDTLDSIIFRDLVPAETTFVPGSITVIGVGSFTDNSTANEVIVDLGTILPPNPITVIHQVLIDSDAQGPILNTSSVHIRNVTTDSNQVVTDIVNLIVSKASDITEGEVGDIITYSVTIDNSQNDAPINNVFVYDNLQVGTSYVPNTTIIGANLAINSDPSVAPGASVGTIAAGAIVIVSFQVSINSVPNPNPIENTADINYEVDTIPKTKSTNTTDVLVQQPGIEIVKSANKEYSVVGDNVLYTSVITNSGTVPIENIIFNDIPPSNTVYDGNGVRIEGINYPALNPNNPIDISTIAGNLLPLQVGDDISISYGVDVISLPNPPQIDNTSSANFEYLINGQPRTDSQTSNNVTVGIIELTVVKSIIPNVAQIGDTVTYTSTITSNISGNLDDNIIFRDVVPSGLTLIPSSINVIGSQFINYSTTSEVVLDLGNSVGNETIIISFDATVNNEAQTPILNTSTISVSGINTPSNEVELNLVILQVSKASSESVAKVGESVTYTVTIDNSLSTADATNVFVFDNLAQGTSYVNNSTKINNGVAFNSNPSIEPGIAVGIVVAGTIVNVSFDVLIEKVPDQNPILNIATINYIVGTQTEMSTTNGVEIFVPDIDIIKSANKEYAQLGEVITYNIQILNSGQVDIEGLIFNDPPPPNTTYIDPSLKINGVLFAGLNPGSPIDLATQVPTEFPLAPGDSISVSYSIAVDTLPQNPVIENTANVEYEYLDGSIIKTDNKNSNNVTTTIREGNIELTKSVDKDIAEVGDTLTYIITAENTGNIPVENVLITDIIPIETEFVEGSVIVNNQQKPNDNPKTGISIITINAQSQVDVSFEVKVISLPPTKILVNSANTIYDVFVDPNGPAIRENSKSNEVETILEIVSLNIIKSCTPKISTLGGEVNYSFTIINNGTIDVNNIKFFDELPKNVEFVEGSFVGATNTVTASDLISGVDIGSLASKQIKSISFKVVVKSIPCLNSISNKARLTYEYELIQGEIKSKSHESNECSIEVQSNSFKQSYKDGMFCIPTQKPDIESIIDLSVDAIVNDVDIITSPIGTSQEGQILSGKKLVVYGKLCLKVTYVAEVETQSVHSAHCEIPICEYLVVPDGVDDTCNIKPTIYIEDIYYKGTCCRSLFYNITYFIDTCL